MSRTRNKQNGLNMVQFVLNDTNLCHEIVRSLMYHLRTTHKNSDNSKNPKNQIFHNKGILEYDVEQRSKF